MNSGVLHFEDLIQCQCVELERGRIVDPLDSPALPIECTRYKEDRCSEPILNQDREGVMIKIIKPIVKANGDNVPPKLAGCGQVLEGILEVKDASGASQPSTVLSEQTRRDRKLPFPAVMNGVVAENRHQMTKLQPGADEHMGNRKPAIEQLCSRAALNRGSFIIRGSKS